MANQRRNNTVMERKQGIEANKEEDNQTDMSKAANKFLLLILDTRAIIQTYRSKFADRGTKLIPSRLDLIKRLILSEISEALTIFCMIYKSMNNLYHLQEQMKELHQRLPSGTVDDKTPNGREFISIISQHIEIISELEIHIKTIYEWLYHLTELFESHPKIRSLVPDVLWRTLQAHCEFRNKLITHKKGIQTYLMGGIRFSGNFDKVEILMMPLSPPDSAINELDKLFSQCSENLTTEEAGEVNFYERCGILYRNLDKFTGDRRAKIVAFIQRYGTISANPPDIAEYIRDLVEVLIPKLVELES